MRGPAPNGIIGREAEGTIVSVGPGRVNDLKIGDRVAWLGIGGYAEYTAVRADRAFVVPSGVKPGIAAVALMQGLTALILTHQILQVGKGDWVLVHAAAGGVGLWLCQLLKIIGARTIGTVSTEEKMKLAKEHGADFTINYREETGLVKIVKEITGGQGVNVVYDGVGKDQMENNVNFVARYGTIVTYGAASGMPSPISPTKLAAKNIRFVGPDEASLMRYVGTRLEFEQRCTKLFNLITLDKARVKIHEIYPLSEMFKVHQNFEGRRTMGKLLVRP